MLSFGDRAGWAVRRAFETRRAPREVRPEPALATCANGAALATKVRAKQIRARAKLGLAAPRCHSTQASLPPPSDSLPELRPDSPSDSCVARDSSSELAASPAARGGSSGTLAPPAVVMCRVPVEDALTRNDKPLAGTPAPTAVSHGSAASPVRAPNAAATPPPAAATPLVAPAAAASRAASSASVGAWTELALAAARALALAPFMPPRPSFRRPPVVADAALAAAAAPAADDDDGAEDAPSAPRPPPVVSPATLARSATSRIPPPVRRASAEHTHAAAAPPIAHSAASMERTPLDAHSAATSKGPRASSTDRGSLRASSGAKKGGRGEQRARRSASGLVRRRLHEARGTPGREASVGIRRRSVGIRGRRVGIRGRSVGPGGEQDDISGGKRRLLPPPGIAARPKTTAGPGPGSRAGAALAVRRLTC